MKILLPLIVLIFAVAAYAQSDLPEIGKLSDIKGKTKVYISADAQNLKEIMKVFKGQKTLVRVDKPDEAEFFIEYKEMNRTPPTELGLMIITGQMDVYIYRDKRKVIAWSDSKASTLSWPSAGLLKKFIKALNE